jgi:hypothetical protein
MALREAGEFNYDIQGMGVRRMVVLIESIEIIEIVKLHED